ncbi:MAG: hypothetical protein UV73_C0005G0100 [Candidatus Gottesmanbacteria bacterium GW2011_GWA2_43_14]|uniref:Uncharacterized protein n=1 Tax=Candidatus Gottesmanbacteria bacterium GW2011_GWA2_43_14 TaxID=1618443 RepID=A0A0G1GG68_9BACT|nr:MAG: hypothetical protein UV73_C0005G0100 [Candidatus Gottesmanbacteria bacterium GW2011_GWA2_43_14]
MTKSARHTLVLLTSLGVIFFFASDQILANFTLQLSAALVVILIAIKHLNRRKPFHLLETVISTMAVVLVTGATGGTSSPFFFLNHFLLFEISYLLEPITCLSLSLGLMVFYLISGQTQGSAASLVPLISFIFMTPLAYLSGSLYKRLKKQPKELIR